MYRENAEQANHQGQKAPRQLPTAGGGGRGPGLRLGAAGPGLEAALPIPAPEASVLP